MGDKDGRELKEATGEHQQEEEDEPEWGGFRGRGVMDQQVQY